MKTHRSFLILALITFAGLFVAGCADPIPDDYVPEIVVEGFLIAGEPINHLRIYQSQPLSDTFSLRRAVITNAQVTLLEDGKPIPMQFVDDSSGGMYKPIDTTFVVKYETAYELNVRAIGKTASATAKTQKRFSWIRRPADTLHYPGEKYELQPADSLGISWEGQEGIVRYVIGMECLDTLHYGEYLNPPTTDTNARVRKKDFEEGTQIANERTRYGFSMSSNTPVVWLAFKWFGRQKIVVYAGDNAFQEWFSLVAFGQRSQYDYTLSNIQGGLGVFAGASKIEAPIFLAKK